MNRIKFAACAAISAAALVCAAAASGASGTSAASGIPGPGSASPNVTAAAAADAPRVVVKYGDLNIATDGGAHILYRRIVGAARRVCAPDSRDLTAMMSAYACRNAAVANAVRQVGSTKLAAEFAARSKSG